MSKELKEALFEINPCIWCKNDIKKCNDCNKPNSYELIKSALKTLQIIKSFGLRTIVENEHYLLIIGSKSYEITKEQYEIISKHLGELEK